MYVEKNKQTTFSRRSKIFALLGVGIATALLVCFLIVRQKPAIPVIQIQQVDAPTVDTPAVNRGLPIQLKIPRINVDAPVAYMGLTKTGDMDTPTSVTGVGWYKYGPLPGNTGTAVISGHIDGPKGEPAVFSELGKLQVGDQFSIIDSTGQSTVFTVREVRTYDQDERPAEVFTSTEGSHLNLITCTGDWDKGQGHFLKRLVVFGDKSG